MEAVVQLFLGALLVAMVSVWISGHYADQASEELKRETSDLKGLISQLACLMHEGD